MVATFANHSPDPPYLFESLTATRNSHPGMYSLRLFLYSISQSSNWGPFESCRSFADLCELLVAERFELLRDPHVVFDLAYGRASERKTVNR